jgi:uncharacterized membrane protein required for colicin V production
MWITIIALIFAAAGCILGLKKGVLAAWAVMFNIMISVYLGLMTVAIIGKYSPDSLPNQWAKAGVLFLTAVLLFIMLTLFYVHLFGNYAYPDLPQYFELIGSGIFGFVAGYLTLWFFVYLFFLTPAAKIDYISAKSGDLNTCSRGKIDAMCNTLEYLSLQEDDGQSANLYQWLETAPEKKTKNTDQGESKPANSGKAGPNTISPEDPNE